MRVHLLKMDSFIYEHWMLKVHDFAFSAFFMDLNVINGTKYSLITWNLYR